MVDLEREIGVLEAKVAVLETELASLRDDVKEILKFVNETRGGKKWLLVALTVSASFGAILEIVLRHLKFV